MKYGPDVQREKSVKDLKMKFASAKETIGCWVNERWRTEFVLPFQIFRAILV